MNISFPVVFTNLNVIGASVTLISALPDIWSDSIGVLDVATIPFDVTNDISIVTAIGEPSTATHQSI